MKLGQASFALSIALRSITQNMSVSRIKDMVIRGGENLYPREIEELLHTHPSVAEVQVFGVPDQTYGEELCAWIRTW